MNSRYTIRKECKNLILFLLISFLLPLASVATQTMISNHFICFILYGIQAAAPTISAIIVLCLDKKVKSYFAQMFRKEHLKMAIILPFIIAGTTMILAKIIFCVLSGKAFMLGNVSSIQFIIILWALLAEEIGWRGYLEPWLEADGLHRRSVPWIVGAVWCLWH